MCHNTEDAKFGEGLTCALKNDMRNLPNFDPALESLKNVHFNGVLLIKLYVWAKALQESDVSWHWRVMQYDTEGWQKIDCWFEKWYKEFD